MIFVGRESYDGAKGGRRRSQDECHLALGSHLILKPEDTLESLIIVYLCNCL